MPPIHERWLKWIQNGAMFVAWSLTHTPCTVCSLAGHGGFGIGTGKSMIGEGIGRLFTICLLTGNASGGLTGSTTLEDKAF